MKSCHEDNKVLVGLKRVRAIRVFPLIPSLVDMRDVNPVISVRGMKCEQMPTDLFSITNLYIYVNTEQL